MSPVWIWPEFGFQHPNSMQFVYPFLVIINAQFMVHLTVSHPLWMQKNQTLFTIIQSKFLVNCIKRTPHICFNLLLHRSYLCRKLQEYKFLALLCKYGWHATCFLKMPFSWVLSGLWSWAKFIFFKYCFRIKRAFSDYYLKQILLYHSENITILILPVNLILLMLYM